MKIPLKVLIQGDLKNIRRDSTLALTLFAPLAIFILLLVLPALENLILERFQFDLREYRLILVSFLSLVPSMLLGMIFGFIVLDEGDEGIIEFISITPLQRSGYLFYKLLLPMLLSALAFCFFVFMPARISLNPLHGFFLALLVAMETGIGALFLVGYSENKVEGMAFAKLLGIMYLALPLVFFWQSPWHWLAAWLPPFWFAKALLQSQAGSLRVWLDLFLGFLFHAGVFYLLLRRFLKKRS